MSAGGLLGLLMDPDVGRAVGRFMRRPMVAAMVAGAAGAAIYAVLTHRPESEPAPAVLPQLRVAPAPRASRSSWIPPTPEAIARHEREVRVWAYRVGQGAAIADVPRELADDVERYVAAGGRESPGCAEGATPYDW